MDTATLAKHWARRAEVRRSELQAQRAADVEAARLAARALVDEFGASEVWLFGSVARGRVHERSDVDIAVKGIAHERYFAALARVSGLLKAPVDLVPLESATDALLRRVVREGMRLDV